jgi:hypothetical protein
MRSSSPVVSNEEDSRSLQIFLPRKKGTLTE